MPFIQRVVQPITLGKTTAAKTTKTISKFLCTRNTCENPKCITKQKNVQLQLQASNGHESTREFCNEETAVLSVKDAFQQEKTSELVATTVVNSLTKIKTTASFTTQEGCLNTQQNGDTTDFIHNPTDDFTNSFNYATDTDDDIIIPLSSPSLALHDGKSPILPMKKLKQHIEFLSSGPSPVRSLTRNEIAVSPVGNRSFVFNTRGETIHNSSIKRTKICAPQSLTSTKIIAGYEFDSISNITLSNALRQLASLVLIASEIFDDLHHELLSFGERARNVQSKIVSVEKQVGSSDPKTITVPESDLLTFAQRKNHYNSEKKICNELFTIKTRPCSVQTLYENAAKESSPSASELNSCSNSSKTDAISNCENCVDDVMLYADDSNTNTIDELLYTSIFGKANRKMRKRIDAEIEIRLPAAIEDLRKWTSTEALGDVTVTPDCMHHVDTFINSSNLLSDTGLLSPALLTSTTPKENLDPLYSITVTNVADHSQLPHDLNKDVPLSHRLPSPEEQSKIIALRYPAEVISVDTSGKRFERMCVARKSTTSYFINMDDSNNLNDNVQTVSRRSRSRKMRSKRRNTIAGLDQKEIQDAANGNSIATDDETKNILSIPNTATVDANDGQTKQTGKSQKFGRSKSSDILKNDSVSLSYDKGKSTLTRLNSLKQWGLNRFKFMQRHETVSVSIINDIGKQNTFENTAPTITIENTEKISSCTSNTLKPSTINAAIDIDENFPVHQLINRRSEGRFSHERKPSYSSSEKSISIGNSGHIRGKLNLATCGNVKLRDTSSLNRQRRNGGMPTGLCGKDDQPHSSSGNWSASSESGRASIGSEITIQPKSSASNTSLNISNFHTGSGPPSSMMSRRKFLNTSASSSVTSEGTATPEFHITDSVYPNHLDDETSSAYSCDTEGYYTSFHMDSGLRTLKEEEPTLTPLQSGQSIHTNGNLFVGLSNQCNLTAENEYELFGKGSTSTTTSSAGTVCTTLLINGERSSLNSFSCPEVPERISSLGKFNKCNHSNNTSTSTLERSYSSSTIGSTLERTSTIKRNIKTELKLMKENDETNDCCEKVTEPHKKHENEFDFEQHLHKRDNHPLPGPLLTTEFEWSESSDLEGVERTERIKQKTAINAKRIPSMCIITPNTSDDENHAKDKAFHTDKSLIKESSTLSEVNLTLPELQTIEKIPKTNIEIEFAEYSVINDGYNKEALSNNMSNNVFKNIKDQNLNILKHSLNDASNNISKKLEVKLPNEKPLSNKSSKETFMIDDTDLYDTAGEYVTIADISNNNRHNQLQTIKTVGTSSLGIYYSNDTVRQKHNSENAKNNQTINKSEVIYISLNDLPHHLREISTNDYNYNTTKNPANNSVNKISDKMFDAKIQNCENNGYVSTLICADAKNQNKSIVSVPMYADICDQEENSLVSPLSQQKCSFVRLNSQGKIIYDSESLKRRNNASTTFLPGPFVKETESALSANNTTEIISCHKAAPTQQTSEYFSPLVKTNDLTRKKTAVELLLQNGISATRKIANVRPILGKCQQNVQNQHNCKIANNNTKKMPILSNLNVKNNEVTSHVNPNMKSAKNIFSNNSNPFYQPTFAVNESTMTSLPSTITTSSTSPISQDEDYHRLYKTRNEEIQKKHQQEMLNVCDTSINRGNPMYWTLQNRRHLKPAIKKMCRDDLYATPIRRSESAAATSISSVVKGAQNNFTTSTPNKISLFKENDEENAGRISTCADRIGQSKTSLMDFKKLLLAKSTKKSPVQKKVSAVELLKKSNQSVDPTSPSDGSYRNTPLSTSMKLMDLNGSPKTFANRRMLRQGQFGSPSKSFSPKLRSTTSSWRDNSVPHTDIMSIIIPEANSDEDQTNTTISNSSTENIKSNEKTKINDYTIQTAKEKFDLKRNFFLQTEENNFMRGELKQTFNNKNAIFSADIKKYMSETPNDTNVSISKTNGDPTNFANTVQCVDAGQVSNIAVNQKPALETAL